MKHAEKTGGLRIPSFEYPWEGACSPYVEQVEERSKRWAIRQGLIPDERYQARVDRTKYGWLAARCYPHASEELLQVIADYFVWFFLADDLFVDRVEMVSGEVIPHLTAMIDVLDFDRVGESPVYGEEAWFDVCRRLRGLLSRERFDRFATGMRLWATTAGLQILNHTQSKSVRTSAYLAIRRHTSGMNPCLALLDSANAGPMTPAEYHGAELQELALHANNVVCWSNDIQSLIVESRQPGQFWNLVGVRAQEGYSLQESVDHVAGKVRDEIDRFQRLAARVEPQASPEVRGTISGMRDWMRGYQNWVTLDTQRYLGKYADEDADDTKVVQRTPSALAS